VTGQESNKTDVELSVGWVDPRVGLGWVVGRKIFQKFPNSLYITFVIYIKLYAS